MHGALEPARIAALEQRVKKDVIGLEHRIGFELAAPVALWVLLGEKEVARLKDGGLDIRQVRIDAPEPRGAV